MAITSAVVNLETNQEFRQAANVNADHGSNPFTTNSTFGLS